MINIFFEGQNGDMFQLHYGYQYPLYFTYDIDFKEKSYRSKKPSFKNMVWKYEDSWIRLESNGYVKAYPSVDEKYVIAIYHNDNDFMVPNNAAIYNLDGTIHKVLKIPELISERSKKHLEKENLENPPLSLAKYPQGLAFSNFGWRKDINGNLVNSISIDFDRDYGEKRELNPETGEIGKVLDDWQIKDRFL